VPNAVVIASKVDPLMQLLRDVVAMPSERQGEEVKSADVVSMSVTSRDLCWLGQALSAGMVGAVPSSAFWVTTSTPSTEVRRRSGKDVPSPSRIGSVTTWSL
jgi:hypothetical protein